MAALTKPEWSLFLAATCLHRWRGPAASWEPHGFLWMDETTLKVSGVRRKGSELARVWGESGVRGSAQAGNTKPTLQSCHHA